MSTITENTVLAFRQVASMQPVADGAVILLADSGQLYTGNGTTEAILRHVDGKRRISDLATALCSEFDIDPEAATADVIEIAGTLIDEGVLDVVG
ncbi:MAG: PqqD family protein [Rhizobiaceae bacterium]|nr:PqqD family protein [Rhizobiaceae bacterium]